MGRVFMLYLPFAMIALIILNSVLLIYKFKNDENPNKLYIIIFTVVTIALIILNIYMIVRLINLGYKL